MNSASTSRLQKESALMLKNSTKEGQNYFAVPDEGDLFLWHFCLFNLTDSPYEGGFYYGQLHFPAEYPFKPPGIMLLTPNGRFR